MRWRRLGGALLLLTPPTLAGCQLLWTYDDFTDAPGGSGASDAGSEAASDADAATDANGDANDANDANGDAAPSAPDPNQDGPYTFAELDDATVKVATGDNVAIHCAYPTGGPSAGPYPVVVLAHSFNPAPISVPASQYEGYVKRLATFGYVALTASFLNPPLTPSHVRGAQDVAAAIDWVAGRPELASTANVANVGVTGHGLGGKLAFLAATFDPRIKASIALDPVDLPGPLVCMPQDCPDMSDAMGTLTIPVGVLGETRDVTPNLLMLPACAPAADNFATFYASAKAPALSVEVIGASHWSFLDDAASCGPPCGVCTSQPPTLGNGVVNHLAKAFVVAFYERWLRGDTRYDDYLTGAEASSRYVAPGLAAIQSK